MLTASVATADRTVSVLHRERERAGQWPSGSLTLAVQMDGAINLPATRSR